MRCQSSAGLDNDSVHSNQCVYWDYYVAVVLFKSDSLLCSVVPGNIRPLHKLDVFVMDLF